MNPLRQLAVLCSVLIAGCAAVSDYSTGELIVEIAPGVLPKTGDIIAFKPYDKRHLLSAEAFAAVSESALLVEKKVAKAEADGRVTVRFSRHMRSGAVWILPLLGSAFLDKGKYGLIGMPDGTILGVAVEGTELTVYQGSSNLPLRPLSTEKVKNNFTVNESKSAQTRVVWIRPLPNE